MIDVVYPLGTGSIYQNFELRMSLRSVEKYLTGVRDVYIIGDLPKWTRNVNHIAQGDICKVPDLNIMKKVEAACRHSAVSDYFLFMNDDHFILQDREAKDFPYIHSTNIADYLRYRPSDSYSKRVRNTFEHLKQIGAPTRFFDCHYPIVYNKKLFIQHVVEALNWKDKKSRNGFVIKSVYANSAMIRGIKMHDYKSGHVTPPASAIAFSTNPHIRANVQRFLIDNFPKKSKFEGDKPGF